MINIYIKLWLLLEYGVKDIQRGFFNRRYKRHQDNKEDEHSRKRNNPRDDFNVHQKILSLHPFLNMYKFIICFFKLFNYQN